MSGQYPTTPVFESVSFTSKFYNLSSTSLSGRTQVRNIGGQRWEFSAKYSRLSCRRICTNNGISYAAKR